MDACTVTAFDVIAAFATSGPNLPLAKPVGFFGSERPANYFALAITQPTSDRQRFIETNPFDRRRKPDIGYAPAASSCERVDHVDACTVSACYVMIAFAISGPSLLLAEPAGFFGSERPLNCFIVRITQPTSDQLLFISTALSTVDAGDPKSEQLIVNTQHLCKHTNIWRGSAFDENRMNCGFGNLHQGCFPDIHSAFHKKRCSAGRTLPIRRQQNHLLTANSACLIVCLRDSFARRFKQACRVSRNNRFRSTAGSRMSGLIAYVDGGSHGSPGPSGIGVVIETSDGEQIRIAKWIGHQDNNVAEYAALLEALQRAVEMKATALHVFTDSQLVVKQMTGEYACNSPRLYSLNWTCRKLARSLNFAIAHIPRHRNQEANRLANDAARASRS